MNPASLQGNIIYSLLPMTVGLVFLFIQHSPVRVITDLWLQRVRSTVILAVILAFTATGSGGYAGAGLHISQAAGWWLVTGGAAIVVLNLAAIQNSTIRKDYCALLYTRWNLRNIAQHNIICLFYIVAYECFLRGWMLQMHVQRFGTVQAVILNTLIYTLLHVPKGKKELAGSAVFGLVLCSAVIQCGSLWPAIGLHGILALSFENGLIAYSLRIKEQRI